MAVAKWVAVGVLGSVVKTALEAVTLGKQMAEAMMVEANWVKPKVAAKSEEANQAKPTAAAMMAGPKVVDET